jgi:hypothetical protein
MFFFFRPKKLHIDCFTNRYDVYNIFPIDYSYKFFPEWWKNLPKTVEKPDGTPSATMKGCVGLTSFFKNGITIPLWTDMLIQKKPEYGYDIFVSDKSIAAAHGIHQMEGFINPNDYGHVKLKSPWFFKCKENIEWVWTQHTWNFTNLNDIMILPGVVEYKYQHGTNINFIINLNIKKNILLESGQPLVNLIPMSDRKIKLHVHHADPVEFDKLGSVASTISFTNKYVKYKHIMKEREKKCPFGFGK